MKKEIIKTGADLLVDTLINQCVKYIFGIPGAKIDKMFDVLNDRGPQLIVARHEHKMLHLWPHSHGQNYW